MEISDRRIPADQRRMRRSLDGPRGCSRARHGRQTGNTTGGKRVNVHLDDASLDAAAKLEIERQQIRVALKKWLTHDEKAAYGRLSHFKVRASSSNNVRRAAIVARFFPPILAPKVADLMAQQQRGESSHLQQR